MSHLTTAQQQDDPPESPYAAAPAASPPTPFALAFEKVSTCLPGCLSVGAEALERGNERLAVEYVIGILDDLASELDIIRAALSPDP